MTTAPGAAPAPAPDTADPLAETLRKAESSLLEHVREHLGAGLGGHGLDFLDAKNTLLLSYLIDLTLHLRGRLAGEAANEGDGAAAPHLARLREMRVALEKTRGLERKLKYQIDKLLAASASAGAFASASPAATEDPLQFRPNAAALEEDNDDGSGSSSSSDDDDGDDSGAEDEAAGSGADGAADGASADDDDGSASGGSAGDNEDDDDDLAAARLTVALAKERRSGRTAGEEDDDGDGGGGLYRAPRHAAVPYAHDDADRARERERRQRRRLRASEVAETLRAQFDEAPEQEDRHGGAGIGRQREAAARAARRAAEKERHEEEHFVRLVTTRKERKERDRLLREESSNLSAIADLGNIVRGAAAFGGGGDRRRDDEDAPDPDLWTSERHANGKRKKYEMNEEGRAVASTKKKRQFQAKNSLQAELFTKPSGDGKKKRR